MVGKIRLFCCAVCLTLLVGLGEAKATFVAVNDFSFGTPWGIGKVPITLDTRTGLQWLDITISGVYENYGNPYHQLMTEDLAPGGRFDEWRLASAAEVLTLFADAGLPSSVYGFDDTTGRYSAAVTRFQKFLGALMTGHYDPYSYTYGLVSDSSAPGLLSSISVVSQRIWTVRDGGDPADPADYFQMIVSFSDGIEEITVQQFNTLNFSHSVGAWLVREPAVIPEPSTFWYVCGGLLLLAWKNRARRNLEDHLHSSR